MLYSEFYERTGVEVDSQEYAAIEECYYHFPGDKDEFCAAWCKMNSKRVKAAKDARKAVEKEAKTKERLLVIMNKMDKERFSLRNDFSILPLTANFIGKKDREFLETLGIHMELTEEEMRRYGYYVKRHKRIDETAYEIKKYLKIA